MKLSGAGLQRHVCDSYTEEDPAVVSRSDWVGVPSGPATDQFVQSQALLWCLENIPVTSIWRARTYLRKFRAGDGLELYTRISRDLKLKMTDHQCSVPLRLSGKTSRSRTFSGICRLAPRAMTPVKIVRAVCHWEELK